MNFAVNRFLRRVATLSVGYGAVRVEELLFDFLLYPYVLLSGGPALTAAAAHLVGLSTGAASGWGAPLGFLVLLIISAATNVTYVRLYDRLRIDWFGFEKLKEWERRWARWKPYRLLRAPGVALAFVVVSVWQSPLFALLLVRDQANAFEMRRREWALLTLAILTANLGWSAVILGVASAAKWLWPTIGKLL